MHGPEVGLRSSDRFYRRRGERPAASRAPQAPRTPPRPRGLGRRRCRRRGRDRRRRRARPKRQAPVPPSWVSQAPRGAAAVAGEAAAAAPWTPPAAGSRGDALTGEATTAGATGVLDRQASSPPSPRRAGAGAAGAAGLCCGRGRRRGRGLGSGNRRSRRLLREAGASWTPPRARGCLFSRFFTKFRGVRHATPVAILGDGVEVKAMPKRRSLLASEVVGGYHSELSCTRR